MTDRVLQILRKYRTDVTERPGIHDEFESVAKEVGRSDLAAGVASSLRSDQTPDLSVVVLELYAHASLVQRADLMNRLLPALDEKQAKVALQNEPSHLQELLIGKRNVTTAETERIPAATVGRLATAAETLDPSMVERIGEFAADHPSLLRTMPTEILAQSLTAIASRIA